MPENLDFFKNNVNFYSEGYKDFSLKPWEEKIVNSVVGPMVLDVACGGGRVTVPLLMRGHTVTGTDFVKEFEIKIRQHELKFAGNFTFVEARMDSLPFPDNTFDSVTCINSIVYMKNHDGFVRTIREMTRVLKPDGKLYLTSWNMKHPLWGSSILLNYILRRGKRFGETSPFFTMDCRSKKSRVHMFVPFRTTLKKMCGSCGIDANVYTSDEFMGNRSLLTPFHPIIVVVGVKKQ